MDEREVQKMIREASAFVRATYGVTSELAEKDLVYPELWASTGSVALDRAINGRIPGGIPLGPKRGCVVHIFGDPSLGKSLILDHLFKSAVARGGICLVSETEGTRTPHFAHAIGLDLTKVTVQRPDSIEELVDSGLGWIKKIRAAEAATRKKAPMMPILWGWDTLELTEAGRTEGKRMSGKEGGAHRFGGGRAEAISIGCRKIAKVCAKTPTTFVILNQIRENVGVLFGAPKKPGGGWAARFFASVEIQLHSSEYGQVKERGRAVGRWVRARIVKNKVAPPFAECHFLIRFDIGVQPWSGLPQMLEAEGQVKFKKDEGGSITGKEFTDAKTGEVFPLVDFAKWCVSSGVLRGDRK